MKFTQELRDQVELVCEAHRLSAIHQRTVLALMTYPSGDLDVNQLRLFAKCYGLTLQDFGNGIFATELLTPSENDVE